MKKFIKLKMDHIETNRTSPESSSSSNIGTSDSPQIEVQPPLPLEPPPSDEVYPLFVKQERDDEYENNPGEGTSAGLRNSESLNNNLNIIPEGPELCRDFLRGTCQRPGTCKYSHSCDSTRLVGVYTFCRKYQTSVCTFQNCKYVHATVFEEHHFYRTGILPPHTFAHQKKLNGMLPPPPPPPSLPPRENPTNYLVNTNVSMNLTFGNPPTVHNEVYHEDLRNVSSGSNTLKRDRNSMEHKFSSSPSDRDTNEPFAKKCKHCDLMDFRLQYNKDKVEDMLLAKENLNKKICVLDKKSEKLCTILSFLTLPSKSRHNGPGSSSFNGDLKRTLLEKLKSIITVNDRFEDS